MENKKTVIVFGSTGMLGRYIYDYLNKINKYNMYSINRKDYDIIKNFESKNMKNNNKNITMDEIKNDLRILLLSNGFSKNTVVFNAIGLIPQAKNYNEDYYKLINSFLPIMLGDLCVEYGANLIQPSTDCVFSGKRGNYNEKDICDEDGIYGKTKKMGDVYLKNTTILRTSIIGEQENNGYLSFLDWVRSKKGQDINAYSNHLWNGITCLQYAKIVDYMITNKIFWKGVRHIFSPEIVTKAEMIYIINNVYDLDLKINYIEDNLPNGFCDKTLSSIFEPIMTIPTLKEQITEQMLYKLKLS